MNPFYQGGMTETQNAEARLLAARMRMTPVSGPINRVGAPRTARIQDFPFEPCHSHYPANQFDACTWREQEIWRQIQCAGGIERICIQGRMSLYESPPWIVMPPNGERFQVTDTIALPAALTNTIVVTYRVPLGWDGVINGIVDRVIGAGFIEGSGDVYWRIRSNLRYFKDYGQITTSLGDLTNPCTLYGGGYRIYSGQLISYLVYLTAAGIAHIDPNALILCSLSGWIYPRA